MILAAVLVLAAVFVLVAVVVVLVVVGGGVDVVAVLVFWLL